MFTKKDFKTYDEYVKAATEPPKPEIKLSKIDLTKKTDKKESKSEETDLIKLFNDEPEPALEDEYEAYKFDWLTSSSYSVYDLVEAVVNYATVNNITKELISDPVSVVSQWEDNGGFAEDMYLSYDEWLAEQMEEQAFNASFDEKNSHILEIIDYLDMGCTKADLIDRWGFSRTDVDKAMEYYRSMGCPTPK